MNRMKDEKLEQIEKLKQLYLNGMSRDDAAYECGLPLSTATMYLKGMRQSKDVLQPRKQYRTIERADRNDIDESTLVKAPDLRRKEIVTVNGHKFVNVMDYLF